MATFIFAGGGTGGHLYPALAIAEQLRELDSSARTVFLCSPRAIDARILTEEGVEFQAIPANPLGLHPARLVKFVLGWGNSVARSRDALRRLSRDPPLHVIAMGGFVAAPVVHAARLERLPVSLVNLDAVPGKANRWIARSVSRIFDAADSGRFPAAHVVRPIVRRAAVTRLSREECRSSLGLDPALPTLFITGGSQGARTMNELITRLLAGNRPFFEGWQVLHQTGPDAEASIQRVYDDAGVPARTAAYLKEMGLAWGAAEAAISRAGAGAVAEVWANAVPTLFLPYPFHRDQHQERNADRLVRVGGALIARDWKDSVRTQAEVVPPLTDLLARPERRRTIADALRGLGPADGAATIARALINRPAG
jgi:UDP-N-acetylglucosamine--N-acetylmuramyl-(pentapeptide) pyrophosphoryl-undecaprenol N-acetylglucosamine transferase